MRKNNFWGRIWYSFNKIQSALITFVGIFISIILALYPAKSQISLGIVIVVVLISLLIIVTMINAFNTLLAEYKNLNQKLETVEQDNEELQKIAQTRLIPKILLADNRQINDTSGIFCLLEKSELFSYNIVVSCYYTDDGGVDVIIGVGSVINIQENGKIQIFINDYNNDYRDVLDKLANNDRQILSKVLIKPTMKSL